MRAQATDDPGAWRQQARLVRATCEADAPREAVRGYAVEMPAEPDAVPVIGETGFLEQGVVWRESGPMSGARLVHGLREHLRPSSQRTSPTRQVDDGDEKFSGRGGHFLACASCATARTRKRGMIVA